MLNGAALMDVRSAAASRTGGPFCTKREEAGEWENIQASLNFIFHKYIPDAVANLTEAVHCTVPALLIIFVQIKQANSVHFRELCNNEYEADCEVDPQVRSLEVGTI